MLKNMIRRIGAALSAAVLAVPAFSAMPQPAAALNYDIVVLGDGISAGSGLTGSEACYTEYLKDATNASSLTNYAVEHNTTEKLLADVQSGKYDTALSNAELTVISIGSYDLLTALYSYLNSKMAPEDKGFLDYLSRIAKNGQSAASQAMFDITGTIREPRKNAIANVQSAAAAILSKTKGKVVFLSLFNPFETRSFIYQGNDYSEYYDYFENNVRGQIDKYFNTDLKAISGIQVADVYSAFYNNGWNYICSKTDDIDTRDMFPNALGQARIAAVLLDLLGYKNTVLPQFETVLAAKKTTVPFYLPMESRAVLYRHAGRTVITESQLGDINGDGKTDTKDANHLQVFYVNVEVNGVDENDPLLGQFRMSANQKLRADTDGSGAIDTKDANLLMRYYNYNDVVELDVTWDETFLS